ncbi:hypothetical protein BDZ97DRAFT_1759600 [Flammula alnicola]|nr:hypothetical protein BDZ97DRAFT_1759600 [Flammula alnicola]
MWANKVEPSPSSGPPGENARVSLADGWLLVGPPYSHYFIPKPKIPLRRVLTKKSPREARAVLKKRRSMSDDPRLRPPKEERRPRPFTYVEETQKMQNLQNPHSKSASMSKQSILLPNLRADSLWLNRPTQPLHIRKASQASPPGNGSYVVANSPILPIGSVISNTMPRPMSKPLPQVPPSMEASTSTFDASDTSGLETLIASVKSELNYSDSTHLTRSARRPSRHPSVATSLSVYSQASYSHSLQVEREVAELAEGEDQEFDQESAHTSATYGSIRDRVASDSVSMQTIDTLEAQAPTPRRPSMDQSAWWVTYAHDSTSSQNVISFDNDVRSSCLTSAPTTTSTSPTIVSSSTHNRDHHRRELSLQPCPSLASSSPTSTFIDLPPDHDSPTTGIKSTYRPHDLEDKGKSPFDDDICADYDYIQAIDVLIYGARPLSDVPPTDVVRRPSNTLMRRENVAVRRRTSDRRSNPGLKKNFNVGASGSMKGKTKKNINAKADNREQNGRRRSIFFQVSHLFGKSQSSA